jgi:hypothetical protein
MTRKGMSRPKQAAQRDKLRTLFEAGWTDQSIGRALGLRPRGVESIRLAMGLVRPPSRLGPPQKVDDEYLTREFNETMLVPKKAGDVEEIRRQIKRVARAAQVDPRTVRRRLQALSLLELDMKNAPKSPEQWERARVLLEDGLPYAEVAREVGIAASTLAEHMPGLGVRPEDHGAFLAAKRLERSLGL